MEVGKDQHRYYECGNYMTWIMSSRYLDRYYFLGDEFGRSGKSSIKMGVKHWHNNGTFQKPKLDIGVNYPEEEPYKCADDGSDCQCKGRVHMGMRIRPDNGEEVETF